VEAYEAVDYISVDLETSGKRTEDTLKDFENDTPHTPAAPIKLISKRLRRASSFDEQDDNGPNSTEAQAAASVGSIEELDFLEGDQLQNEDASETGYMGRNSQVQWLRSLRAKLRQPEEEGCVSWRQLMTAKEEDFDRLGFKLGHRRKIQRAIATMDGYPQSEPLPFYGVRTVQVNSNLARDMLSFSGHHEDQSVFLMTKESKQPQEYLHFDAHSPKRAITSVLNNLSSSQGATRSKPIRLLIEEGHLAESPESIKVRGFPISTHATIKPNLRILERLACAMRVAEEAKKIRLRLSCIALQDFY
jgi:hypothetical protein